MLEKICNDLSQFVRNGEKFVYLNIFHNLVTVQPRTSGHFVLHRQTKLMPSNVSDIQDDVVLWRNVPL